MRSKKGHIFAIILVITTIILLINVLILELDPFSDSRSEYSLIIDENDRLEAIWKYDQINHTLIASLENESNIISDLKNHKEGELIKWEVTITDDVERSWCTGALYYWELTIDKYITSEDYFYEDDDRYQDSQKYQVHKYPEDFARVMLLAENYFTYMIIPIDAEDFLKSLKNSLQYKNFGHYDVNPAKYGFEKYEDFDEWLSNQTEYYEINGMSIDVEIRNDFDNKTVCTHSITYNTDGLLEESLLTYENQVIMKMSLEDYEIYDYGDYPVTFEDLIKFSLIVVSIIICSIILLIIIVSYHKIQSKEPKSYKIVKEEPKKSITYKEYYSKRLENRKRCLGCNTIFIEGATFCHNCGKGMHSEVKFCAYCGKTTLKDSTFCFKCGNQL